MEQRKLISDGYVKSWVLFYIEDMYNFLFFSVWMFTVLHLIISRCMSNRFQLINGLQKGRLIDPKSIKNISCVIFKFFDLKLDILKVV